MTAAADASGTMARPVGSPAAVPGRAGLQVGTGERVIAALACALVAGLLAYAMGRDLNWDYFNYHGYAAFDPFGQRLTQDYFPAGYQGYLLRLAYLPFGLMDGAGWHSLVIGVVLASLQSLNLLFLYLIAREIATDVPRPRVIAATLTVLGAAASPFLQQLGSTFVDPLTTVPSMAALWLMVRSAREPAYVAAGLLAGVAVALKLTNVPFALGIVAAAAVAQGTAVRALRQMSLTALATGVGFAVVYAPWGWKLYERFGSPVFPLFNHVFKAPEFPAVPVSFHRFVPQNLEQVLTLPFAMAEHRSWVYVESVSPDVRPAVLVVLAVVAAVVLAWRARRPATPRPRAPEQTVAWRLTAFFLVSLCAWLATSGNGRYATPLLLLLGPLVFLAAKVVFGARRAAMLCLVLLAVQALRLVDAGNPRWEPADWAARWLPAQVSPALTREPFLFISTSNSSEAYLAGHVHPASVFVNPIGLISLPTDGPGWAGFIALRDRYAGRIKVMFPVPNLDVEEMASRRIATMNGAVDRLGLRIETTGCEPMLFDGDRGPAIRFPWRREDQAERKARRVMACPAQILASPSPVLADLRRRASEILDAFALRCPSVFAPVGAQTEGAGRIWSRLYGKHDLLAMVDFESGEIAYRMERQPTDTLLGHVATWQRDAQAFQCRLPQDGRRDISTLAGHANR